MSRKSPFCLTIILIFSLSILSCASSANKLSQETINQIVSVISLGSKLPTSDNYFRYRVTEEYKRVGSAIGYANSHSNDKRLLLAINSSNATRGIENYVNAAINSERYADAKGAANLLYKVSPKKYAKYVDSINKRIEEKKKIDAEQTAKYNEKRAQEDREKKQQEQRKREAEEAQAKREARGSITISSEVAGKVLLNGKDTTWTIAEGGIVTITIESADDVYLVSVQDDKGVNFPANDTITIKRTTSANERHRITQVETLDVPITIDDIDFIQNVQGGITITRYKGKKRKVVVPQTISGIRITEISSQAFANNSTLLVTVSIPNTITKIPEGAFMGNKALQTVILPNSITEIGSNAFEDCKSITSITLPNSITEIGSAAFRDCISITSITLPTSLTEIAAGTFLNCGLTALTLHNRLTKIGAGAFSGNKLQEVDIPSSVRSIGSNAFSRNKITKVAIPNGVTYLGSCSFGDNLLTSIVIPPSLASYIEGSRNIEPKGFKGAFMSSDTDNNAYYKNIPSITSITLPADVDERNFSPISNYSSDKEMFGLSFVNFWKSQNKRAGTYTTDGRIWSVR